MYLSDDFYRKCEMYIPRDLILNTDNKYDLPVYIALCFSYEPYCQEEFSVKRVLKLTRMFRSVSARNKSMEKVAGSLLRLHELGYIHISYCGDIDLKQSITKSRFLYGIIGNYKSSGYLSVKALECNEVLDSLKNIDTKSCGCSLCTLLHIYLLFRLNSYFWQRTYEYQYPAWVGGLHEIYGPLGITQRAMSEAVRTLRENNIISICYGITSESISGRAETIVIFNKAVEEGSIDSMIHQVKERYNKSNILKGSWYPPNLTVANSASNGVINKAQQCAESTNGGPNGDEFLSLHAEA